jgi:hypothetical protein
MKYNAHLKLVDVSDENERFYGVVTHFDDVTSKDNYQFVIRGHDTNEDPYNVVLTLPKNDGAVKATGTYRYEDGSLNTDLEIMGISRISKGKIRFDGTFFETYADSGAGYGKIKLRYKR